MIIKNLSIKIEYKKLEKGMWGKKRENLLYLSLRKGVESQKKPIFLDLYSNIRRGSPSGESNHLPSLFKPPQGSPEEQLLPV